jgi:hypothetical protein
MIVGGALACLRRNRKRSERCSSLLTACLRHADIGLKAL